MPKAKKSKARPAKRRKTSKKTPTKKKRSMPKRKSESLTGGTGDVNPQYMHGTFTQLGVDTTTSTAFNLPITRIPQGQRVTILEVLKIWVMNNAFGAVNSATEQSEDVSVAFSTINMGSLIASFNEPNVFAYFTRDRQSAFSALGTYAYIIDEPRMVDLTDGAGHGFLLANDQMFIQCSSAGTGLAMGTWFKMLYRFKTVGIVEYVGIVQSQQ